MRHLDRALVDGDQAVAREHRQDVVDIVRQLGDRHAHAHAAFSSQAQQDPPHRLALTGVELLVGALGQPCDRAAHAAGAVVGAQCQVAVVALLPQFEQRGGQQRERAGLTLDVGEQCVDELRLDAQAGASGRELDCAPQLVAAHRADQDLVGAEQARELREAGAVAVEVGAHGDEHERAPTGVARARHERVDERRALRVVAAGGERLLELVDRDDPALARGQLGGGALERRERVRAGADQRLRPALAAGQDAVDERGQQAGAQGRGLAAGRRPDDAHQPRPGQARDHVGHQLLTAEEHWRVVNVERREALERARGQGVGAGQLRALAHRLELDHLGGDVVPGQMPAGALGRCPRRRLADALGRHRACPSGCRPVHARGDAATLGEQAVHRRLDRCPRAGVIARQRGDLIARERRQWQRLAPGLDRGRDGEHGWLWRHLWRLRDVVEDEQRRPVELLRLAVSDGTAIAAHLVGELLHEPRLSDARRSGDHHAGTRAGASTAPEIAQVRQLGVAPDQWRAGQLLPRRVERRVLAQNRLMQPPEIRPGLDADLLYQRGARCAVCLKGVGLAGRAVERDHALRVKALAQRLVRQQGLDLRQHFAVAPGVEVVIDRDFGRARAQILEAPDLRSGERLVGDVAQGRPPPQAQRLPRGALGEQPLEAARVHPVAPQLQLIATPTRGDGVVLAVRGHRLAQPRDVDLHHLGRRRRRLLAPEPVDQALGRDGRAGVERQHRQQGARLRTAEDDSVAVRAHLHGSEQVYLHVHPCGCRSYFRTGTLLEGAHLDLRCVWPSTARLMRSARAPAAAA